MTSFDLFLARGVTSATSKYIPPFGTSPKVITAPSIFCCICNSTRFDETLNEYIIEWAHQSGIEASLNVDGFIDVPLETKQAVYRIMQEALANVAKHSGAQSVEVTLDFVDHSVDFCIRDDGIGFDTQQQHEGMGLDSMRERVEALQGVFSIQSEPEDGTKVCITIPIE